MRKNKTGEVLILSEKEIKSLLMPKKVLELVEQSFSEYSNGNAVNPVKLHLPLYPHYEGYINSMPAYLTKLNIAGVKVVSVYKDNMRNHQLPCTMGTILLNDARSGIPYALMDGTYITAVRTGAVIGVMAKYLVKNNARAITIVGSGTQGLASFIMIAAAVSGILEARIVDINPQAQDNFINHASKEFPNVSYVKYDDIQTACNGASIIVAAATSPVPLLSNIEFDKGTTVLCVEEDITTKFARRFDCFISDFVECFVERTNITNKHHAEMTGEPYEEIAPDDITGEIGDIITNKIVGRKNDNDIVLAASVGMGIQDIIVASYVYERAVINDIGTIKEFVEI